MTTMNRQILLHSRPRGAASVDNFRLLETPLPDLQDAQVLVRHQFLSLDPYMRGRMNEGCSYAAPQPLGEVMAGGTVGEVLASRHPRYQPGDRVAGMGGWQAYAVVDGHARGALRVLADDGAPLSAHLGALGMPGATAWYGLNRICAPQPGQTVVVSAASGAVGSVVGQLAKAMGCRAVGIAGGPEKCRFVIDELGFDACVDHRAHPDTASLRAALKAAAPDGIDACLENVGGHILDAVLTRMNDHGRIALCGMIAG